MSVSVPLTFIPPTDPDITELYVYEAPAATGPWTLIDTTTAVGTYPDYITRYVTTLADSATDWFSIAWGNSSGAISPLSGSVQGGTSSLIGEIVERVLLRSPDLDENFVLQEAEATVSFIYNVTDPYTVDISTVDPLWLTSLAELTMVAVLYVYATNIGATSQDYTAGMISERNSINSTTALNNLERLERRILRRLGIGGSLIAKIESDDKWYVKYTGVKTIFDSSRLLSVRATLTDLMVVRDVSTGELVSPTDPDAC